MPVIAKNNDVISVIIVFSVEPERQQELIEIIIEFINNAVKYQPGFVSASLHKSLDGIRVMNSQWQSLEAYNAFLKNTEFQAQGKKLANFNPPDLHVFEVVISQPENAILEINTGDLIHLAEFRIKPENQQRFVELAREYISIGLQNPGLISANFHRSLDGTRIMNYGQWRSLADFESLLQDPKYKPLGEYWQGLAENEFHLYKVVSIQSANN